MFSVICLPVIPTVRLTVVIATRINAVMKMKRFSVEETLNSFIIYKFVRILKFSKFSKKLPNDSEKILHKLSFCKSCILLWFCIDKNKVP